MNNGEPWWIGLIKAVILINVLLISMAFLTLFERKLLGRMQLRYGPNRAGPKGILQPFADLIKMVRKEAFAPMAAIDILYLFAPAFAAFTALLAFSVIPWGEGWQIWHYHVNGEVSDMPISLIVIFALGSLGIYGFIVGGWASESKYSMLGSMRTCAQMVSYEVSLALSVLGVVLMAHTLSLSAIVDAQVNSVWYAAPQFVGLVIFFIAGVAETNRPPFDLPEADTELVGGYHTEYSGMRWGLFQMAEYVNVIVLSALAVTLFFGGWEGPWAPLGPRLVPDQAADRALRVHLDPRDAAAPALRPADALRLEGAAADRDRQRRDHGPLRGDLLMAQPISSLKGFAVTFGQLFKKPITQQYPEYKRPVYPRFRGRHKLHLHENGLEKCVGCSLCAAACPADCIRVVAAENTPDNRVSAGERYARIYEINMSRCIFCGYCELACPFDAITLGNEFEISEYSRDDLIYTKDMLLADPVKRMPVADRDEFDTPIPYYKSAS